MKKLFYVLLLVLVPQIALAATYYMCNNQTDCNTGSSGWGSLCTDDFGVGGCGESKSSPKAFDSGSDEDIEGVCTAGNTIIFGNGTYTDEDSDNAVMWFNAGGGGSGNPCTLQAENKHGAVIDGESATTSYGILLEGVDYVTIDGFKITGTLMTGMRFNANGTDGSDNCTVQNTWFYQLSRADVGNDDSNHGGLYISSYSRYATVDRCKFETIGRTNTGCEHCYRHDQAIYARGWGHVFTNNIFIDIPAGYPISLRGYDGTGPGSVFSHKVVNNTFDDISNPDSGKYTINIYTNAGDTAPADILIQNNVFGEQQTGSTSTIQFGSGGSADDCYVYNNVLASSELWSPAEYANCNTYTESGTDEDNETSSFYMADYTNDDFRLTFNSTKLIDTGRATDAPDHDYLNVSRPSGVADDIGAYEYVDEAINCTTLVADGSSTRTDNASALNTCLSIAAAQTVKICNIPSSEGDWYYWSGQVTVPEGVSVIGASGAEVEGGFLMPNDDAKIINLTFHQGVSGYVIEAGTQYSSTAVDGIHIRDCDFTVNGGNAVIVAWYMNNGIIDNNTIDNNDTSSPYAQNIELQAGSYNVIVNNVIDGGKTGIIFKYDWTNSGNSPGYFYNVIMDNTITEVYEEYISFDMGVNGADSTSMREADTIASVSSNQVTLSDSGWGGGDDPNYVGKYLVVVVDTDGGEEINGEFRKITGQSNATFTLESAITGLEVGDWVSIGAIAAYNYIAFNTCDNSTYGRGYGRSAPLLYGMSFYNRIEENDTTGISIRSLDEHFAGTVTGNGGRGPASYNLVRGNTVTRYGWTSCTADVGFCDILAIYRDLEKTAQYADYKTWGNVVVDNTIGDDLYFTLQDYYQSGNTYDSLELSNSTDAGSTSLDTTDWTCEEYGLACMAPGSTIARVEDLDDTCAGEFVCQGYIWSQAPPPFTQTVVGVDMD